MGALGSEIASGRIWMNDEWEGTWKGAIVLRYYTGICLEGLRTTVKTSVRVAGVPSEMRTERLHKCESRAFGSA